MSADVLLPQAPNPQAVQATGSVQSRTLLALLSMVGRELAIKLLALVGWVVLARLLDLSTFGLFAVSSFAVNLFVVVFEVGLGASFVRDKDVDERELAALFTYQLLWVVLLAAVVAGGWPLVSIILTGLPVEGPVVPALALSFVIISLRTVPSILTQRRLAYGPLVVSDVLAQAAYWIAAIAAAFAGSGAWSVVAACLAFSTVGTVVLFARVGWMPSLSLDWRRLHSRARFSLSYQGQQAASLIKYAMLPALGGMAAGISGIGYVTWAHQIAVVPIQLTQLVSRVSFPAMSRLQDSHGALARMTGAILKWTCRLTFPACALLIGLGPQLTEYVYGAKWLPALPVFYLFAANTAINAPVGVLLPILYALGRGTGAFRILVGMVVLTWLSGLAFIVLGWGIESAAMGFLVGMIAAFLAVLYEVRDLRDLHPLRSMLLPAISAVLGASLLHLFAPPLVHSLPALSAVGAIAGAVMLAVNLWGDYGTAWTTIRSLSGRLLGAARVDRAESSKDGHIGAP
ncbi:MAG: oligosaccharide flippase family protein [Chloroflexota bacterium]